MTRPLRAPLLGALAIALVPIAAAGWYLGSPLFIRTSTNEAFPTAGGKATSFPVAYPAGSAASSSTGPIGTATIASGMLGYVDALHHGTGRVLLVPASEGVVLRFEDVAMTNAPDVHVYLSRETGGRWTESSSLYLGPLRATNGSFNYIVPRDTDVSGYRSVVVWCRQFSVLVTWADLR